MYCLQCDAPMEGRSHRKFCSDHCGKTYRYQNVYSKRRNVTKGKPFNATGKCLNCDQPATNGKLYCDAKCGKIYRYEQKYKALHKNGYYKKGVNMPKPRFQVNVKQISFIPEVQEYHRYTEDAPKCKCGCGRGLCWAGELLTGYKLTCRNKRPLADTLFASIERN